MLVDHAVVGQRNGFEFRLSGAPDRNGAEPGVTLELADDGWLAVVRSTKRTRRTMPSAAQISTRAVTAAGSNSTANTTPATVADPWDGREWLDGPTSAMPLRAPLA